MKFWCWWGSNCQRWSIQISMPSNCYHTILSQKNNTKIKQGLLWLFIDLVMFVNWKFWVFLMKYFTLFLKDRCQFAHIFWLFLNITMYTLLFKKKKLQQWPMRMSNYYLCFWVSCAEISHNQGRSLFWVQFIGQLMVNARESNGWGN